jgi:hypothetical protein
MLFGQFTRGVVPGIREELAQARGPTDLRAASAKPFPQPGGVLRKARGAAAQRPHRSFLRPPPCAPYQRPRQQAS